MQNTIQNLIIIQLFPLELLHGRRYKGKLKVKRDVMILTFKFIQCNTLPTLFDHNPSKASRTPSKKLIKAHLKKRVRANFCSAQVKTLLQLFYKNCRIKEQWYSKGGWMKNARTVSFSTIGISVSDSFGLKNCSCC